MSKFALNRRQALAGFSSLVAASPLLQSQQTPPLKGEPPGRIAPRDELLNSFEFEQMAKRKLGIEAYSLIAGSDRRAFDRMTYRPRLMVDVTELDLTVELLGDSMFTPILVGPVSEQKRFHPEGELAMARGASAAQAGMVVSSRASFPIEEIAGQAATPLWYQVYPEPDEAALMAKVQAAVKAGCKAVCLTVGTPYEPAGSNGYPKVGEPAVQANPGLDWGYVDSLRQQIDAPLLLKGIMSADEAVTAVGKGIQGIIVSNHGDRYLTGLAQPMTVLPEIVEAVSGKIPVLIDGSFRRGSDILKALALGARAVLLGRPPLWGLAAYGAAGVQTIVELLQTELAADMAMCGAVNLGAVTRDLVKTHRR
jgi:isopentenyl diphosphate isomerase/L-lactate dehydrogenase-like FMN-dependent dehydrogenase